MEVAFPPAPPSPQSWCPSGPPAAQVEAARTRYAHLTGTLAPRLLQAVVAAANFERRQVRVLFMGPAHWLLIGGKQTLMVTSGCGCQRWGRLATLWQTWPTLLACGCCVRG